MNDQADSDTTTGAAHCLPKNLPRLLDLYEHSDKTSLKNYFNVDYPLPLAEEENRLARLDSASWRVLRDKAVPFVCFDDPARRYQQLWNTLDEARGYEFLAEKGYAQIEFIKPSKKDGVRSPDLIGRKAGSTAVLEVKTINESQDNLGENASWRNEAVTVPQNLSEALTRKIVVTIEDATDQLKSYPHPTDRKIVFLVIRFDHGQKTGWHLYSELKEFIATQAKDGIEVFHEPLL